VPFRKSGFVLRMKLESLLMCYYAVFYGSYAQLTLFHAKVMNYCYSIRLKVSIV
jgi:hypothetical protein